MRKFIIILTISLWWVIPTSTQEETPVCNPPAPAVESQLDSVLTVDDTTLSPEQFANRIRFEHAYNNIQLEIRIAQLNEAAENSDLDPTALIANDSLVSRITAENDDVAFLGARVLDDLQEDAVVYAYALANDFSITQEQLNTTVADFFQFTEDASDEEQQSIINEFTQRILINGTPPEEVEAFFCRQTLYDAVQEDVIGNPDSALYADVDHILVSSQEVAQDIINLINAGDDFATLAQDLSLDASSGQNGGALGLQPVVFFVPEFASAIITGEVGTILAPVQTQFGWHVIRINSKEERPIEEDWQRNAIINSLFSTWRNQQINASTISINPDWQSFIPEL